jgi:hypothetical protein
VSDELPPAGPPPLRPFGLVLHHDGRFSHEGEPILNRRLREHFDRSVGYLPDEKKFIIRLQHFRGEVEVEEAGFFVREVDLDRGEIMLSDGTRERLDVSTLAVSAIDGALLCRVKTELVAEGLLARFSHSAQAELLEAVEPEEDAFAIVIAGERIPFPEIE